MKSKLLWALGLFLAATVVWAQTISTSQIRGTVTDESGAAVAGANVKLTQTATSAVRSATSAADGSYVFPALPVGSYQLEVTRQGFTKYLQTGIVLQVGVNPTIDVTLKVGAMTEQVTVEAQAAMVETQSTGVGQVVAPQQVQDLPLNGRQLTDLLTLTGGVSQGRSFRASYPSSATPSIAGGAQGSVAYWLDGGTHNDPLSNQNLPLPFPDTVEEFKVETSSLPAQYGTHPSGAVNVVTKSGSNSFHGDVFEYLRNDMFDAINTAYDSLGAPYVKQPLKRNQFGGTIGGPIQKDKLFFFLGWQDTIQRSTNPATPVPIPTAAMQAGNFQACLGTGPGPLPAPFVNNIDPTWATDRSPIIKQLETYLPTPTNPCGTYNYQRPNSYTENQGLARIDYHLNNKNTIFGRYFITNLTQPPGAPNLPASQGGLLIAAIDGAADRVQSLTLGDTYLIGTNMVNSFRATGNRSVERTVQNQTMSYAELLAAAGLPAPNVYQLGAPTFPKFLPDFRTQPGLYGLFPSIPSLQPYDTIEFSDDLALTHGAHQFSFGADFINLRAFATNYLLNQGQFAFDGSRTGVTLADFLLGQTSATSGFSQDAPIPSIQHQNVFALYAQDAWKVTRRLTVTAGLRWDPFFGHTDPKGHVVSISIPNLINNVHSTLYPTAPAGYLFPGDPGGPSGGKLTKNALNKWSPRIGVAWDPKGDGRMSIRAGFGMFYDFPNFSYDQFGFEEPYGGAATAPAAGCTTTCLTNPWAAFSFTDQQAVVHTGDPFPQYVGTGPKNAAYLPGALVFSYPQTIKPTYVMQYNLSVEKQVGTSWLLSATYIGNQQRHLWGNNEANPGIQGPCPSGTPGSYTLPSPLGCAAPGPCPSFLPPFICSGFGPFFALNNNRLFKQYNAPGQGGPLYGETLLLEQGGTGNYNGLILSAQHRFAHHFTSSTNYTWSHCISDNSTTTLGFFLAVEAVPYTPRADRGNCPSADTHNVFNQSLVAESPKFSNHTTEILAGNWRVSVSALVKSGTVLSDFGVAPTTVLDISGSGNGYTQRPNVTGNPYCASKGRTCWLNPASFSWPHAYTYGNLRANSLFGPGAVVVNTALSRIFQIREGQQLEFRWEVFNLANHVNLYGPSGTGAGFPFPGVFPSFGKPTPASITGLGAIAQTTNDPRIMQFALKYKF
ncbi:MAG: TonB-dependent receptor [Acidobacteriia bacterium]|nr:TonB-dependent receptor [Terriglobia bacterium]